MEEAEAWGERELQNAPRLMLRWGLSATPDLRRWLAGAAGMPVPALAARTSIPVARYYARAIGADEAAARRAVEDLPGMLDRADALLADGTLTTAPPNAATFQILSSVRALDSFEDLRAAAVGAPLHGRGARAVPRLPGTRAALHPARLAG